MPSFVSSVPGAQTCRRVSKSGRKAPPSLNFVAFVVEPRDGFFHLVLLGHVVGVGLIVNVELHFKTNHSV